jgi:hypothetical protein
MMAFQYVDALSRFDEALALGGGPALFYNSGRALEMLGRYPDALDRLRSFEARATPELLAKVPNLGALIADLERHTCELTVRVTPAGATVRLGDVVIGKAPIEGARVNAQQGARLFVTLDGHDDDARLVDLPRGGRLSLAFDLKSRPGRAGVDDELTTPSVAGALAPSARRTDRHVDVSRGAGTTSELRTGGLLALGLGGASLIAGALTGGMGIAADQNLRERGCRDGICPFDASDEIEATNTLRTVSMATLYGGGGLALGGLVLMLVAPRPTPRVGLHLSPWVTTQTLGVQGLF